MKKIHLISIAAIVLSVAAILVISATNAVSQKQISPTANAIPDNVKEILKNSCASCHDTGGKQMAQSVWSLSSWESYSAKKQAKKAKSICSSITKGAMPPSSVRKATPEKIPSAAQLEIICSWVKSLNIK